MSQFFFWGFLLVLCGGMIWAIAKIAEVAGEARALREQAAKEARNAKAAGAEVARHTTTSDTVGRLSDGKF